MSAGLRALGRRHGRGRDRVKKVDEYLAHAAECREMARTASPAHKAQLESMAETWEQLARSRQQQLVRLGRTDDDGSDLNG